MRALASLAMLALLAGCSGPGGTGGPAAGPPDQETDRLAELPSPNHVVCGGPVQLGIGTGDSFARCDPVPLWTDEPGDEWPKRYRSARIAMEWQAPPTLVEAYLEFEVGEEAIASASSGQSPIVLEFDIPPTFAYSGVARYGGTGLGVSMDVTITIDLFDPQIPDAQLDG